MATVRGNSDLQSEVLDHLAGAENDRHWLVALATPWLGPRLRSLEQRREPPFGQSLFAVGRKP
jgi:hypothetical protein